MNRRDIEKLYIELRDKCLDQIMEEAHKGPNRAVCIIREYNRKWNILAQVNDRLQKDGFIKVIKNSLLNSDFDESYKNIFKYL